MVSALRHPDRHRRQLDAAGKVLGTDHDRPGLALRQLHRRAGRPADITVTSRFTATGRLLDRDARPAGPPTGWSSPTGRRSGSRRQARRRAPPPPGSSVPGRRLRASALADLRWRPTPSPGARWTTAIDRRPGHDPPDLPTGGTADGDTAFAAMPHQRPTSTAGTTCDLGTYPSVYGTWLARSRAPGQRLTCTAPRRRTVGALGRAATRRGQRKPGRARPTSPATSGRSRPTPTSAARPSTGPRCC